MYAPSSPGLPYVSPTYQAQKAPFQYQQISLNAAVYEVWYVPGTTTLILVIMASFPQTHFYGLMNPYGFVVPGGPYQTNSIQGNFSIPVYVNYEKTYLVIPANSCPSTDQIPSSGYTVNVDLVGDAPPAFLFFQYTCQKQTTLTTVTLGNPHIIVPKINPPPNPPPVTTGHEALNMESYAFTSNYNLTIYLRNTGSVPIDLMSYYVKDASGNQYVRTNWASDAGYNHPTSTAVNAVGVVIVTIGTGASPPQCGTSCSLTGTPFQFTSGYSYTITIITSRNNQFTFTVVR
ncbi:hypothetical protein AUF78_00845 [archaeon 13_1_20CM_2_51_12]|nr:MAG: hypothetical protein AUF78_00845 [archaeon 13_1_20CM_2_51_12]